MEQEQFKLKPQFRLLGQGSGHTVAYSIHEVIYDQDEDLIDYIKIPVTLIALDPEELIIELEEILRAFDYPILSIENFPNKL